MSNVDDRITQLERRINTLETLVRKLAADPLPPSPGPLPPTPAGPVSEMLARRELQSATRASAPASTRAAGSPTDDISLSATTVLGFGGVAALVLAAAYLIRLAIDTGWLTPTRQIAAAGIFGLALIVSGIALDKRIGRYAALLPAGGVAVLYLTVYGAHVIHRLIGGSTAVVGVAAVSLGALAIRAHYGNNIYLLFAVVGTYVAPLLLDTLTARTTDLIMYFAVWDIVFCLIAYQTRQRAGYLIAAYLAFAMFDASWRMINSPDWMEIAQFHAFQFLLFSAATVAHSYRNRQPLTTNEAYWHMPPLLFFYVMECSILYDHMPDALPWLAAASALPLIGALWITKNRLSSDRPGELIVTAYCALVFFHAFYLELVATPYKPLCGTAVALILAMGARWRPDLIARFWPIAVATLVIFVLTVFALAANVAPSTVVAPELLALVNAALLSAYANGADRKIFGIDCRLFLYVGHALAMSAAANYADNRILVSLIWGAIAVASLTVAISKRDQTLGQSALWVFGAFAGKVLLFDLAESGALVKIACLVVLGASMYLGGILYRRISAGEHVAIAGS